MAETITRVQGSIAVKVLLAMLLDGGEDPSSAESGDRSGCQGSKKDAAASKGAGPNIGETLEQLMQQQFRRNVGRSESAELRSA